MKEPKPVKICKLTINNKEVGKVFKQDQKAIKEHLEEATEEEKFKMMNDLETNNEFEIKTANGKEFKLTKEFVTFEA